MDSINKENETNPANKGNYYKVLQRTISEKDVMASDQQENY